MDLFKGFKPITELLLNDNQHYQWMGGGVHGFQSQTVKIKLDTAILMDGLANGLSPTNLREPRSRNELFIECAVHVCRK